jgi:hypothetical protein
VTGVRIPRVSASASARIAPTHALRVSASAEVTDRIIELTRP